MAATAFVAALVGASTADASRYIQKGLFDDAQILYGNPDTVFPTLAELHTQLIRVDLWWGGPAVRVAKSRPVDATDPSDPAYDWTTYDRTVTYAKRYGMRVMFTILGTPSWANGGRSWNVAPMDSDDLKDFATAAARRYNGTFRNAFDDPAPLPRVPYWLVWNEPNNPVFLKPQYDRYRGKWEIVSGRNYAKLCNASVQALKAVSRTFKVGCGVTAPRGNNNPTTARPSVSPLPFLRAMIAGGAKGFDAYAHNPYAGSRLETPKTAPPKASRGQAPTAVTLGNFSLLTKELARLKVKTRIWVTEYGYQTNPPDRLFGVSWANQRTYLEQAWAIMRKHPKIDMFIWFLLRDEPRISGWQSGLYTASGKRKDAREGFEQLLR